MECKCSLFVIQTHRVQDPLLNGGPGVPEVFIIVVSRHKLPLHSDQGRACGSMGNFILHYTSSERRRSLHYYCAHRHRMEFHKAHSHGQGKEALHARYTIASKRRHLFLI